MSSDSNAKPAKSSLFKRIGNLLTDAQGNMRWQAAVLCVTVLVAVCGLVGTNVPAVVSFRENLLHNYPSTEPKSGNKLKAVFDGNDPLHAHWDDVKGEKNVCDVRFSQSKLKYDSHCQF